MRKGASHQIHTTNAELPSCAGGGGTLRRVVNLLRLLALQLCGRSTEGK